MSECRNQSGLTELQKLTNSLLNNNIESPKCDLTDSCIQKINANHAIRIKKPAKCKNKNL